VFSGNNEQTSVKARGDRLRGATLAWLDSTKQAAQPTPAPHLIYLQYMEPHSPYEPKTPFRERFERPADGVDIARANARMQTVNFKEFTPAEVDVLESLYDGEVASVDAEIRTLFAALEVRGLLANAVVIITADHGEEFKEHGRMAHGHALYNESIRVPLIIVAPGIEGGKVIEDNVSLVDVAPTILDLAGLPAQPTFEGTSLVSRMQRRSLREWLIGLGGLPADVISELPKTGSRLDVRGHSQALLQGQTKLLVELRGAEKREVPLIYDLQSDPGETAPAKRSRRADAMQAVLQQRTEALVKRAAVSPETGTVDDATKEKLRALGYQF
jgi:arylsulfatase A-like enzyme